MPRTVLSVEQTRAWEAASWNAGKQVREVIQEVGRLLSRRLMELTRPGDRVLVLCGKGNNGEDAAQTAAQVQGRIVDVIRVSDPARGVEALKEALAFNPGLVVDGLFGIGLDRPLDSGWVELIRALNSSGRAVLAVDVPSGLDADTGLPLPEAVEARWTVALGALKHGLLTASAARYVGRLELLEDIGLVACEAQGDFEATLATDFEGYPPARQEIQHKHHFGHLAILAGSVGFHGAAVLAAYGAARAKPGLTSVFTSPETYVPVASHLIGTMVAPWHVNVLSSSKYTALLLGPGLAAPTGMDLPRATLSDVWRNADVPVVVDASALEWLPPRSVLSDAVRVITPHSGEAARMLGVEATVIDRDRPAAVRALSTRFGGAWVVLKGSRTLIGRAEGPMRVNLTGNPGMAIGGSGDILAGYIGGLLAQSTFMAHPLKALSYAVWMHGLAADYLESKSSRWVVEDLAMNLGVPFAMGRIESEILC